MCCSTIKALRQEGRLDEALAIARADLEACDGVWENRSLYWVLRDVCRTAIEAGDRDRATGLLQQMREVLPKCDEPADGPAAKTLASLQRQLLPHSDDILRANDLARDPATADDAYRLVAAIGAANLEPPLHNDAAWVIYRYLKHRQEFITSIDARRALALYISLTAIERPSLLHSLMLVQAINIKRRHPQDFCFTRFIEMWGTDSFRHEDWQRDKRDDGGHFPSLVEKAIGLYLAEVKERGTGPLDQMVETLLRKVIDRYHDSDNLRRVLARQCLFTDRRDEAVDIYRRLALTLPQPYVWAELGEATGDNKLELAALCKAIDMCGKDLFAVNYRLRIAELLINSGNLPRALSELQLYREAMTANGYKPKRRFDELMDRIPRGTVPLAAGKHFYAKKARAIEDFVYHQLPLTPMVAVNSVMRGKGKWRVKLTSLDGLLTLNANVAIANGNDRLFLVRHTTVGGKARAVTVRPTDEQDFPGLAHHVGTISLKINSKGDPFCFIDDCYVGAALLDGINDGDAVTVTAVTIAGRQRAISLTKQSTE